MAVPLEVDGAWGEGGGQIVRTAVSIAAITGRAIRVTNVRAGRSRPGLQPQHLAAVKATARLCGAELLGAERGSECFEFNPGHPAESGHYHFEIGTAGSAVLLAQTVLLPLAMSAGESTVVIRGGTHVPFAPTIEYFSECYLPALALFGVNARAVWPSIGFIPEGGGELHIRVGGRESPSPVELKRIDPEFKLTAYATCANLPSHVTDRAIAKIEQLAKGRCRFLATAAVVLPSSSTGAAITLVGRTEGGLGGTCALGRRGLPVERLVKETWDDFLLWGESAAAVDRKLSDQLVLPAGFASGLSTWTTSTATRHLHTVTELLKRLLNARIEVEELPNGTSQVRVWGSAPG